MPAAAKRAPGPAREPGTPDPVYLLHGDNEFLKEEKTRALIDQLADAATRDFNLDVLRGGEADAGRVANALDALPVMAERRVVVIRDFSALKKEAMAVLTKYLEHPASDTVVVLVAPGGWKGDAAISARCKSVPCKTPSDDDAQAWTVTRASSLGLTIDGAAARALVQATGRDLGLIDGELRKLRDFTNGGPVDAAAIAAVVGVVVGATSDELLDLACARDGVGAANMVPTVLTQPKATGVGLLMALSSHLLLIGHVVAMREAGIGPKQSASDVWAIMNEMKGAVVGRPWGAVVSCVTKHADKWDRRSVDRALASLAAADQSLKESSYSSEDQILATCLLGFGAPSRGKSRVA
jgi:DNA polymerase-3 subunit delta